MLFQGKDGELRVIEKGSPYKGSTYYLQVLFCNMDFSCPIERPRTEERIIMNRGTFDSDTHYVEGSDEVTLAQMSMTFSCMVDDKQYSRILTDWLCSTSVSAAGATIPLTTTGNTKILSWDGSTLFGGVSLPAFADTSKNSWRVEVLWDGTNDYGQRFEEVYFPPDQQTITEAEDGLTLSVNALVYGAVSRISVFAAGTTKAV